MIASKKKLKKNLLLKRDWHLICHYIYKASLMGYRKMHRIKQQSA